MAPSVRQIFYIENVGKMTLKDLVHYLAAMGNVSWKGIEVVFLYSKPLNDPPLCAAVRMSNKGYIACMKWAGHVKCSSRTIKIIRREDYKKLHLARWMGLENGSRVSVTGQQHWATRLEAAARQPVRIGQEEGCFFQWDTINLQGGEKFCYPAFDCGCMLQEKPKHELRAHCGDVDQLLECVLETGVQRLILMGSSIKKAQRAKELALPYPDHLRYSVGYHPEVSRAWREAKLSELEALASDPGCVAIGECGFDISYTDVHPGLQYNLLRDQVKLACKLRKPLLIFENKAQDIVLEILALFRDELPPVAIRPRSWDCDFSLYIERGFYIRVTGSLFGRCKESFTPFFNWLRSAKPWQLDYLLMSSGPPTSDNYPAFADVVQSEHQRVILRITQKHYTDKSLAWHNQNKNKWKRTTPLCIPILIELTADGARLSPDELSHRCLENAKRFFQVTARRQQEKRNEKKSVWREAVNYFLSGYGLGVMSVLLSIVFFFILRFFLSSDLGG